MTIQVCSNEMGDECGKERSEMQKTKFDETIIEAVDDVFSLLGEQCKSSFYAHLGNSCNMDRIDIPERIDDFTRALEAIFGLGAKVIEIEIMKALFKKVRVFTYSRKQEGMSFINYVKKLRCYAEISRSLDVSVL